MFQRDGPRPLLPRADFLRHAALGGTIDVPTLDGGRSKVKIPEGTQSGHQFRLQRQGNAGAARRRRHGDLYVEVAVETPVKLSKRQKELLREFEGSSEAGTSPQAEGFLSKLKEFWGGVH